MSEEIDRAEIARRRLLLLAPLGVAAAGGLAFWQMLKGMQTGHFDPHDIGQPMLNKPMPDFDLPALPPNHGFSSAEVREAAKAKPILINFFASWCIPCAAEADALEALEQQGAQIWGIAYKDKPDNTRAFLDRYGNPYSRIATDDTGRTFIDFGLFGVPENFLIDASGKIVWHLAGPISEQVIETQLKGRV
jgi:cytochrome c biogenesis protein CcmG/thiol:disulfide interchange protein DsbE